MTKMMDLSSTGLRRSYRSDNKPKQKYDLFHKLLLAVIVACEVTKNPHIFLSRVNQHIQEIFIQFHETLNHFGHIVFEEN